uniref:Uncharacterized protein n=1 Tax=Physcomitrium patens TaxID=3218 RepID=A0A2K1L2M3_PHYPA|nr:hypothetical protein PHYPA_003072 [Physcomitrium patens]
MRGASPRNGSPPDTNLARQLSYIKSESRSGPHDERIYREFGGLQRSSSAVSELMVQKRYCRQIVSCASMAADSASGFCKNKWFSFARYDSRWRIWHEK